MGQPSDDVTASIKEAIDIVQLISEYTKVEANGPRFKALCPFHQDSKPSMQIDPQFRNYRCWVCQAKGDAFTFLQEMEGITFAEAKVRLAARAGIKLTAGGSDFVDLKAPLYQVLAWAEKEFQNYLFEERTGADARQYLAERKFEDQTLRAYGLGASPPEFDWLTTRAQRAGFDDRLLVRAGLARTSPRGTSYDYFRGRVVIPIRDTSGRVIGFGGRVLPVHDDGETAKYLNSPATDVYNKSGVLYGLDVAAKALPRGVSNRGSLVVMEGYMDCLMAYQAGLKTCVATCGTALTAEHIQKLRGYTNRVVLMFDGDKAGKEAARKATTLFLESQLDLRLCMLPDELDPCDFLIKHGADDLQQRIEQAPDALEFTIDEARGVFAAAGLAGRDSAVDRVVETLASVPVQLRSDQQQRFDLAVNRVAEAFRIEERVLRERIGQQRAGRSATKERFDSLSAEPESERLIRTGPLPLKEKLIAELLVVMPSRAGRLKVLHAAEVFRHPDARLIADACYRAHEQFGESATTEAVRERLNDSRLDALVLDLLESAPKAGAFERCLEEVCDSLEQDRKRRNLAEAGRLGPTASDEDHLALLRELRDKSAF
ncbi:DNA primase [bacterium]|jgi:DNA primase|nr:DNA primase [bacterium]